VNWTLLWAIAIPAGAFLWLVVDVILSVRRGHTSFTTSPRGLWGGINREVDVYLNRRTVPVFFWTVIGVKVIIAVAIPVLAVQFAPLYVHLATK